MVLLLSETSVGKGGASGVAINRPLAKMIDRGLAELLLKAQNRDTQNKVAHSCHCATHLPHSRCLAMCHTPCAPNGRASMHHSKLITPKLITPQIDHPQIDHPRCIGRAGRPAQPTGRGADRQIHQSLRHERRRLLWRARPSGRGRCFFSPFSLTAPAFPMYVTHSHSSYISTSFDETRPPRARRAGSRGGERDRARAAHLHWR